MGGSKAPVVEHLLRVLKLDLSWVLFFFHWRGYMHDLTNVENCTSE